VAAAGLEALRARARRSFLWGGPFGTGTRATTGRAASVSVAGVALVARGPGSPLRAGGTLALAVAPRRPVSPRGTPSAVRLVSPRDRGAHERALDGTADDLQPLRLSRLGLRRQHVRDVDAVDVLLGVDPQDVAHLGARRQQAAVELALGLTCARRTPGPRAVAARTGELDLEPYRHPQKLVHRLACATRKRTPVRRRATLHGGPRARSPAGPRSRARALRRSAATGPGRGAARARRRDRG
jgi:hypothetical protein